MNTANLQLEKSSRLHFDRCFTIGVSLSHGQPVYSSRGSGPVGREKNSANAFTPTIRRASICGNNSLTQGKLFVSNFSAQCNERPQKQRAEFQSQRQNKPMFSNRVFRAPGEVFDPRTGDTSRSLRDGRKTDKNVGVRASRNLVNKGGVAYGDESGSVSLDSFSCDEGATALNSQGNPPTCPRE